jgi:hypothetical protein
MFKNTESELKLSIDTNSSINRKDILKLKDIIT